MTPEQARFVELHRTKFIVRWQWIFGGGTIRAWTDDGLCASLSATALGALCDAGLVECFDVAGVRLKATA